MRPYYEECGISVYCENSLCCLRSLPNEQFNCCVTSPPYWGLRDYGVEGQIGLERTPEEYVAKMVEVFREVRRVLRNDGTLWLNLGDSYATGAGKACSPGGGAQGEKFAGPRGYRGSHEDSPKHAQVPDGKNPNACVPTFQPNRMPIDGLKAKDLVGIPWMVAFALRADGWYLRSDIIWAKPNPMPESVTDRPTKSHEYLFLLAKSEKYYYNAEAIAEPTVSDHGSGNGFKREARLSFLDGNGPRGNDKPWKPNGKHSKTEPQSSGRRITESVARARATGADHDNPFGGTRNKRSVWTINTQNYSEAHFATFPEDLVRPCILAGAPSGGSVLDPFCGSGTTLLVAQKLGCAGVGIEINPEYCDLTIKRLAQTTLTLEAATTECALEYPS